MHALRYVSPQPTDDSRDFSSHHQSFDVSSLSKNLSFVRSVDMSRVQSDALPYSLLPSKVICETGCVGDGSSGNREADSKTNFPKMLADARSIDTMSMEDIDQLSTTESIPRRSSSPQQLDTLNESITAMLRERECSPLGSGGGVGGGATSVGEERERERGGVPPSLSRGADGGRPNSAPSHHSVSMGAMGQQPPYGVTDGSTSSTRSDWLKDKRQSLDVERQKRMVSIQEGARAALHYSAKRKISRPSSENTMSAKSETLPRESRSHSLASANSNDDVPVTSHSFTHLHKGSSPVVSSPPADVTTSSLLHHHESSLSTTASDATPLNLRNLSIDQTKEASLNQMDEIWRQVEAIGDAPSSKSGFSSLYRDHPINDVDGDRNANLDPKDGGMELNGLPEMAQERRQSDVIKESDVFISMMEPVSRSTPIREPVVLEGGVAIRDRSTSGVLLLEPSMEKSRSRNRPTSKGVCVYSQLPSNLDP